LKKLKAFLILLFLSISFLTENNFAATYNYAGGDSVNVMVEASLFFEAYKIKQFEMFTIEKGFNVINNKPDFMPKYKIYKKIDKVIWAVHDDSSTTDKIKQVLADTALYLYDKAVKYDSANAGYYLVRKGYVLDKWKHAKPEDAIAAYEKGFALGQDIPSKVFYLDQLGTLYRNNMEDNPDYKMKALDVYLKLSDLEPENGRWPAIVASLAEDQEQLKEFMKKAWDADKQNPEKAWKYAKVCKRLGDYASEIEPLLFLTETKPEVINYWNELARAYQKNDQTDKAVSAYKRLISLQPNNRDSYFNLALLYKNMGQYSVARNYLKKAAKVSPGWDYPLYIEAGLYEQAARNCGFDFKDKLVYKLAQDTYRKVAAMGGEHAAAARDRVRALANSVPTKEDYFFRKKKNGDVIKIGGKCYGWINKSVTVSM